MKNLITAKGKSGRTYLYRIKHNYGDDYEVRVYSSKRNILGFRSLLNHGTFVRYKTYSSYCYGHNIPFMISKIIDEVDVEFRRKDEIERLYEEKTKLK